MISEIEERRSIRKYEPDEISHEIIEDMILSATLAPSAKNRQPWKFLVFEGDAKKKLTKVMKDGVASEKETHAMMPNWAFAIPDAENTVRVMEEAPCLIVVLNTNRKTPFEAIESEERIVEICDSLSIGAAIENMLLTAVQYDLGTLWIANTCFAYQELVDYLNTDDQLVGIVAVGVPGEHPAKRPRKKWNRSWSGENNMGKNQKFVTREAVLQYGLEFPGTYLDAPFHDPNWQLVRLKSNKKAFLWTYLYGEEEQLRINIKVDPEWRDFWRDVYPAVIPGYHQNKDHWNTVILDGSVKDADVKRMIAESYDLVKEPEKKTRNAQSKEG